MANEKHLLLTIRGSYTNPSLSGEQFQTGVRLILDPNHVVEDMPLVGTLPNDWDPVAENISRTETDWTIEGNWRIDMGGGVFFNPDDYLNDQVAPAVNAWWENTIHWGGAQLQSMQLYPIGPNGTALPAPPYSQGTPCTLTWTSNLPVGTGSGGVMPLQIAVVASHRTPQTGRRGRGRMFLPGISATFIGSDGQIASTQRQDCADRQSTLLESLTLENALNGWVVRPIVTGAPWTSYAAITQVQVGSVPDTQRRRRNALVETVSTAAVSP